MKYFLLIIVVISVLLFVPGREEPPVPASGLKVRIGVIAPISGENSVIGQQGVRGISIARLLQYYLYNGDEIDLIVEDDQSDPAKTVSALDTLVNKYQVSSILLLSGSDSAIAVAKVADKYKTPVLATIATNPETVLHSKYVSQLAFDDATQAMVAALFVRDELFIKRVAVFKNPGSAYSNYLAKEFVSKFKSVGGQVTDVINLAAEGPNNYADIVAKIQSKGPVLLYLPVGADNVIAIASAARKLDWSPKMLATDGMLSTVIERHKGDLKLINGMLATDLYSSNMVLTDHGKKLFKYIERPGISVTTHMLAGMEGYGFLLNAINQCEAPFSKECINESIHSSSEFVGISGKIIIDASGRAERTLFVNKIKNGKMKMRVKVN